MRLYLAVPAAFDRLKSLESRLAKGHTSAYDKAVAFQAWFHRPGFTYSLTANPGNGAAGLARFLLRTKTGSCQQFAFGMAVLARLAGIPARVVIGFTQGTFVSHDNWVVRTSDAHAWPELYFNGAGWLTFEPTPPNITGSAGQGTATVPPYSDPQRSAGGAPSARAGQQPGNPGPTSPGKPSGRLPGKVTSPGGGAGAIGAHKRDGTAPVWAAVIVMLVVLLLTPGAARVILRRWRWRSARGDAARAHAAWRELCDDLADHRIPWRANESPRTLARRIAGSLGLTGADREALARVARAEERASYAASPADSARLRADTTLVRRAVTRACGLPARWSARIAPTSVLAPAWAGVRNALDALGRMEHALTRARPFRRRTPRPGTT
jgi:hypothetical protein